MKMMCLRFRQMTWTRCFPILQLNQGDHTWHFEPYARLFSHTRRICIHAMLTHPGKSRVTSAARAFIGSDKPRSRRPLSMTECVSGRRLDAWLPRQARRHQNARLMCTKAITQATNNGTNALERLRQRELIWDFRRKELTLSAVRRSLLYLS